MNRRDLFKLAFGVGAAAAVPLAVGMSKSKPATVFGGPISVGYDTSDVCLCDTAFECSVCDVPTHHCAYCNRFFTSAHYCKAERYVQSIQGRVGNEFTLA